MDDAQFADSYSVRWCGGAVEIIFTRRRDQALEPGNGPVVVGHVFMDRAKFEAMPDALKRMMVMRELGDQSPE